MKVCLGMNATVLAMVPDTSTLGSMNRDARLDFESISFNVKNVNLNEPLIEDPLFSNFKSNCLYYDENSFIQKFSNSKYSLILNMNIQYLSSKFQSLKSMVLNFLQQNIEIDLISFQEISQVENVDCLSLPGYQPLVFKSRSNSKGGGVGFYVKEGIKFSRIDEFSIFHERVFESVCIEVEFSNRKILFISIYRPPGNHPTLSNSEISAAFFESLNIMFDLIKDKHCYILTDSNFDLLQVEKSPECSNYLDLCISNGFMNLITKATRFTSHSNTLIDQILCNINLNTPESGVLLNDLSDHLPCFTTLNFKKKVKSEQKFTEFRDFSEININLFRENLSNLSWDDVLSCPDPLESFDLFWNSWSTLYNLHFPVKKSKFNKNFHKIQDFISKGLLTSRRTKLSLYQDYLSSRNPLKFEIYKNYRNLYNKLIREAKKLYYEKKLESSKSCPKKMWGYLYEAIDKRSTKSSKISMIKSKGLSITEPSKIADTFNTFFSEIADEIRS